jgi:hypothetical protein
MIRRRQSMFADQRDELIDCYEEGDCVNETQQSQDDEARQPIVVSVAEKFSNEFVVGIHNAAENVQRSTPNVQYRMQISTTAN